jgi:glycosyltransferase involved in cell wall biosynthesis
MLRAGLALDLELSIVMPCLNEVRTLGVCIANARGFLARHGVAGEVVVADNGSTDGSQAVAETAGARVVPVLVRGYGAAISAGVEAANGRFVIMGDSDDSYDFSALLPFLARLRAGDDLVMGNRFRGTIAYGAMPILHRTLGNPALSLFGRLVFRVPVGDVYCGLRGFSRAAFKRLDLRSVGMEFALEMIVKATLLKMRLSEVPITLSVDGRGRPPHLRTWSDGRRSLLVYLACMPSGLFFYPGLGTLAVGLLLAAVLAYRPLSMGRVHLDIHTLLYCGCAVTIGFQLVSYSVFLRLIMTAERLLPPEGGLVDRLGSIGVVPGLAAGGSLVLAGLGATLYLFRVWQDTGFGNLDPFYVMRFAIPSATAIALGLQVAAAVLFLSLVRWRISSRHTA